MKKFVLIAIAILFAVSAFPQMKNKKFESKKVLSYLIYTPEEYSNSGESSPLLLFLHGAGERGNDLNLVKQWGPPKIIENGGKLPFVVVAPQCPAGQSWDIYLLKDLLDEIISTYHIDKSRVYLTGLSMGGFGSWALGSMFPDSFAAIAPICGGGNKFLVMRSLKDMPLWVFHGKKDMVVPESASAALVEALKANGSSVKYTVLPEGNHADSWIYAYNEANLWDWFLQHKKQTNQ